MDRIFQQAFKTSSNCLDAMRKHLVVNPDTEIYMCVHVCVCVHTLCLSNFVKNIHQTIA